MALKPDSPNSKRKFRRPKGAVGIAPDYPEFAKVRTPTAPQQKTKSSIKAGRIPSPPRPQPNKKKTKTRTWKGWFLSSLFKYSLLYSLYVYIWTCPKDGSDDRTICDLGDRTLDIVEPYMYDAYDFYIEPYYDEYLASYVDKAAPYIISANEQYIRPARVYAVEQFEKTGRPLLVKAKDAAVATLSPYAQRAYNAYLAEFVATGREAYDAYAPTIEKYGKQGYDYAIEKAYPYYLISLPYLEKAWEQGIETAGWAGVEGKGWISRRWGIHVEPQLWRIQERLGLKGLRGTRVQDGPTPPHRGNPNASDTAPENILEESYEDIDAKETPQANSQEATGEGEEKEKKKSSAEQIEAARPRVEADLESWGAKFEEAGVKASADVVSQLDELCGKVMKEHGTLSTEILTDLEARIEKEYRDFEQGLGTLLDSPAETKYVMVGYDGLVGRTMQNLKEKQTQIKGRTQELLMDTYQTTAKIVDAALAEMDSAHDIGMQELGMKWAWMEGVTYKDWAKYHDLKKAFGSLKTKVIRSGQGHKGLREVTDYAKSIDDAAADVLKVARVEVGKLEKLGRQRLVKACAERDAAEVEKEAAGKSDKQIVGDVERDEKGEVVKEVPPSDATKEVPEPKEKTEKPADPSEDESNHTPGQGQAESERQQKAEPEGVETATLQERPTAQETTQPEPEAKPEESASSSSEAASHQAEGRDTTEKTESESEPEAQAQSSAQPEAETPAKSEPQPETEAKSQPEASPESKAPKAEPESAGKKEES
ncbi:hypothetical protein TWF788_011585 [Orbilia oligospora]|uniref:Uncharacterized protein n=1 Tax=Orbilia oligospora TaxID=2813651 RepID=A0A6G1MFN3_ORBOL|nr:hypothetical protein TWF788_011585 [Orbilia oligospora]KAF3196801.1 hypothetical protein TWF679_004078 [Orbilia oligospora]KAF3222584.1 hypothetical protein TWF191_006667 [Orbilia oligospora]KAF3255224.1 hypothetical protein TWF192_002587 [Orbilia oligospora]